MGGSWWCCWQVDHLPLNWNSITTRLVWFVTHQIRVVTFRQLLFCKRLLVAANLNADRVALDDDLQAQVLQKINDGHRLSVLGYRSEESRTQRAERREQNAESRTQRAVLAGRVTTANEYG